MYHIRTSNINWQTVLTAVIAVTAVWIGLATLLPPRVYEVVSIILVAVQSGLLVLVRSGKYVEDRNQVPPTGGVK
jgi:hypothetical protein